MAAVGNRLMKHILIIDDDPSTRDLLGLHLRSLHWDVSLAEDGQEGLEVLAERPADLVIVDIFMPRKDGIETILELRAAGGGSKILAISGGGTIGGLEYLSYAKVLGADEVLSKPITKDRLIETVTRVIGPGSPAA